MKVKPRLNKAKSIPGTLQYHAIISIDESTLKLKKTSLSSEYKILENCETKRKKLSSQKKKTLILKFYFFMK